jgi:hypothetical protein
MGTAEVYTGFWWGGLREREHLEVPVTNGMITLRWSFRKWDLTQDRDRWRAFVSTVMNYRIP